MLPHPKEDLARRRWVWQAVSDLFLDEEVSEDKLRYIAQVTAECGYTSDELDAIYRREVATAVAFNIFLVAGTWGYWDSEWLEKKILRPPGLCYWFDRVLIAPLPLWLLRHEWARVRALLPKEHERVRKEQEKLGEQWKPICSESPLCLRWESSTQSGAKVDQPYD